MIQMAANFSAEPWRPQGGKTISFRCWQKKEKKERNSTQNPMSKKKKKYSLRTERKIKTSSDEGKLRQLVLSRHTKNGWRKFSKKERNLYKKKPWNIRKGKRTWEIKLWTNRTAFAGIF